MYFLVENEMDYGPDHYTNKPSISFGAVEDQIKQRKYMYSIFDNTERYRDPEVRIFKITCPYCGYHRANGGKIMYHRYVTAFCSKCGTEYPI